MQTEEQRLTGPLPYTLTNDYMFKVFLQRNEKALRGLTCALLALREEDITSIELTNPIILGDTVDDKTIILDVRICLNCRQIINIEMQVANLTNWEERSIYYLCRAVEHLRVGENYHNLKQTIHIGILDFTPKNFPEVFYADYR